MLAHAGLRSLLLALCCIGMCVAQGTSSGLRVAQQFVSSAKDIDLVANTVVLPLHKIQLPGGTTAWVVVTEASSAEAARAWGVSYSPALAAAKGSSVVQETAVVGGGAAVPPAVLEVPAGVDFAYGKRSVTPNPTTAFPPTNFTYSAQGEPGYSPLLQLPDGTILNAPQVAVLSNGKLSTHPKVVSVAADRSSVVFQLTPGFSQGQPIVYISTGASSALPERSAVHSTSCMPTRTPTRCYSLTLTCRRIGPAGRYS